MGGRSAAVRVLKPDGAEVTRTEADIVHDEISRLKRLIDDSYLKLGELLHKALNARMYTQWVNAKTNLPYQSFDEYLTTELGFKERKGMYLISIWKKLKVDCGLSEEQVRGVGWSHAKEIARVAENKEDALEWIDKAKTATVTDLANEIRTRKAEKGESQTDEKLKTLKVTMFEPQYETVLRAMELAKTRGNTDKPSRQLELVALEFCASSADMDEQKTIEFYTGAIERVFGVKVLVFQDEDLAKKALKFIRDSRKDEAEAEAHRKAAVKEQKGKPNK